ncbi:receptor-type tyrosine-protein phosphatase delta-like isoform X3 [Watersipora subatra]|uniref:receptor-type tyrosine-protein phosphatase delta-like isoform X3 n=1 Tax=Watersipora subatra TaxID=2589382 RepID=UPI00355B3934
MWNDPVYLGGVIRQYQYQCKGEGQDYTTNTTAHLCHYASYSNVSCSVRAETVDWSSWINATGRTLCGEPEFPHGINFTERYEEENNTRTVEFMTQNVKPNCESVESPEYRLDGVYKTDAIFKMLKAVTVYNFSVKAVNNAGNTSVVNITVLTGEAKPDSGPVVASNSSTENCVNMSYSEPLQSNGNITNYKYRCNNSSWQVTTNRSLTSCGFNPGEEITCEIQAGTVKGFGPSTTFTTYATCTAPDKPVFNVTSFAEANNTATLNISLEHTRSNCQSMNYTITIELNNTIIKSVTKTALESFKIFNLSGFTNYTVAVNVENNIQLQAESTEDILTAETMVPGEPTLRSIRADSRCVYIHAEEPTEPNGADISLLFTCIYNGIHQIQQSDIFELSGTATFCEVPPDTSFDCTVQAVNTVGQGPPVKASIYTKVTSPVNLAYNKTAKLSQNYSKPFPADLAVNGILTDFTHTSNDATYNWWMVDLAAKYSLAKIVIYSRRGYVDRMTGISILTSNSTEEVDSPSLDSSNWTRISYKASYSLIETLDLSPSRDARHLAVYNVHAKGLALAEVEVFAAINLASNKPTRQSTEYNVNGMNFSASNAVNGRLDDFSHTGENKTFNWWKVDLGRKYSLGSIILHDRTGTADVEGRLKWVHVLISNSAGEPSSPSLSSPDWIQLSYRENPYPSVGSVEFTPPAEAQHVAVYNNHSKGLCLVEVKIYEYNYAADKPASQSSSYNNDNSGKANDGDLSTSSNTDFINHKTNQWWKVDLQRRIVLREIRVYVRNGLCDGGSTNCSTRLQEVYLLTNPNAVTTSPSTTGENGWSTCCFRNTSIKEEFTEQCDLGLQNPVTRLFSIRNNKGISVELREVEIFGFEFPQLTAAINLRTEAITSNSISISFLQWKQEMIGGLPPTQYRITLSGKDPMFPEHQNSSSQRVNVTFDQLNPGQVYNVSIACSIQGIDCPGEVQYIQATTNCTAPGSIEPLNIDCQQSTDGFPIYWNCTANWTRANANCPGNVRYLYGLNGTYTNETEKNSVTFSLSGHQLYNFIVEAKNSDNISSAPVKKGQQSGVLAPQFETDQLTVIGTVPGCVNIAWETPTYPGGTIQNYKIVCDGKQEIQVDANNHTVQHCEYAPFMNVTCAVAAFNTEWSEWLNVTGRTLCADPTFSENISSMYEDTFDNASNTRTIHLDIKNVNPNCESPLTLMYKVNDSSYQSSAIFSRLRAVTTYTFMVNATNRAGNSSLATITVVTEEAKPASGPKVEEATSDGKCVYISWNPPGSQDANGEIIGYRHQCTNRTAWNETASTSLKCCGYEAGQSVTCDIQASTSKGFGPSTTVSTTIKCSNPEEPKFELVSWKGQGSYANLNITLQDTKSYCQSQNYTISLEFDGEIIWSNTTNIAENFKVENLFGFTNYSVTIQVVNNANLSNEFLKYYLTAETVVPGVPFVVFNTNESCVEVLAQEPEKPNGEIKGYGLECTYNESRISKTLLPTEAMEVFCGVPSATPVSCSVVARNSIGNGPKWSDKKPTKLLAIDPTKSKPEVSDLPKGSSKPTYDITIKAIPFHNVKPRNYLVMMEIPMEIPTKVKRSESSTSVVQRCIQSDTCYIAANTNSTVTAQIEQDKFYIVTIGSGDKGKDYEDKKLKFGSSYSFSVGVEAIVPGYSKPLEYFLAPVTFTVPAYVSPTTQKPNIVPGIAGGVASGVLVIIAAFVIFYIVKRRASNPVETKKQNDVSKPIELPNRAQQPSKKPLVPNAPRPPVPGRNEGEGQPGLPTYDNVDLLLREPSEPIPVKKLEWYNKTNIEAIRTQYKALEKLSVPKMDVAQLAENKGKCRYKGLYPANKYRVKLQKLQEDDSDFINASFMKGYNGDEKQYIAAQGPFTDAVVRDFWIMIWQQRPSAIVMVTRAVENSKMKCKQYWPLEKNSPETFGEFRVVLKETKGYTDFAINYLQVTMNGETRRISQFNYTGWPDHGVPDIEVFVSFHRLISTTISHNRQKPLLIHCSAGVGRTGTYIALDYLLDQAAVEGKVDMFQCVKIMRERRPCMIQTMEQYELLHNALYEALATKDFTCKPAEIERKLQAHQKNTNFEISHLTNEFRHAIQRSNSISHSYSTAKLPENQMKNRFSELLPSDHVMPYLLNGANGNYINAVIVDSYQEKKQWIATQLPLSNTIADFWQLILEQEISIVVQLEGCQTPFYPMKDSTTMKVKPFNITRVQSSTRDVMKVIEINLETGNTSVSVDILALNGWLSESLPSLNAVQSLCKTLQSMKEEVPSQKICVTCLDGSRRCGLFICAYNALERLETEQMVDVYYASVMAKQRRPQFIPTIEQYEYLYELLHHYTNSFAEYANV